MSRLNPGLAVRVSSLRDGDPEAFRQLVKELAPPMLRHATALLGEADAAQEIVQQAFVRIWRGRERLDGTAACVRSYCFRTLVRLALDERRAARRRCEHEATAAARRSEHVAPDPALAAVAAEAWAMALQLPDSQRDVLLLRFGCGLSLHETADALEVPEGTVSTWQRAALGRLRQRFAVAGMAVMLIEPALGAAWLKQPIASHTINLVEASVMAAILARKTASAVTVFAVVVLLGVAATALVPFDSSPDVPAPVGMRGGGGPGQPGLPGGGWPIGQPVPDPDAPRLQADDDDDPLPDPVESLPDVYGTVVDNVGAPVAGAMIQAIADGDGSARGRGHQLHGILTATNDDGSYRLVVMQPGRFTIVASLEGYETVEQVVELAAAEHCTLNFTLTAVNPMLDVRVVRSDDSPVAGATVSVLTGEMAMFDHAEMFGAAVVSRRTLEVGRALFATLPAVDVVVAVRAPGFAVMRRRMHVTEPVMCEMRMTPASIVTGRVVDTAGNPVADARVQVSRVHPPSQTGMVVQFDDGRAPQTDSEGRFRVEGLEAAIHSVTVRHGSYVTGEFGPRPLASGATLDLGDCTLESYAVIEVTVIDSNGRPVSGAVVTRIGRVETWHPGGSTTVIYGGADDAPAGDGDGDAGRPGNVTGPDGRAWIRGAGPGGVAHLKATRDGLVDGFADRVAVGRGTTRATIVMPNGGTLRGVVHGPDGEALAGAEVVLYRRNVLDPVARTTTGQDGAYTLEAIAPGVLRLVASHGEQAGKSGWTDLQEGQSFDVDIELAADVPVVLTILDGDGLPLADARVEQSRRIIGPGGRWSIVDWSRSAATTDASGRVVLNGRWADRVSVGVMVDGETTVFPPTGRGEHTLRLPGSNRVRIFGSVRTTDGRFPQAMVAVERLPEEGLADWRAETASDSSDGGFNLDNLPPGRYRVTASVPGYATTGEVVEVAAGAGHVALELAPAGAVLIATTSTDPACHDLRVVVTLLDGGNIVRRVAGMLGSLVALDNLAASATYTLRVEADGHETVEDTVMATADSAAPMSVTLLLTE